MRRTVTRDEAGRCLDGTDERHRQQWAENCDWMPEYREGALSFSDAGALSEVKSAGLAIVKPEPPRLPPNRIIRESFPSGELVIALGCIYWIAFAVYASGVME